MLADSWDVCKNATSGAYSLKVPRAHTIEPSCARLRRAAQNDLDDRRHRGLATVCVLAGGFTTGHGGRAGCESKSNGQGSGGGEGEDQG